jgi:hypothetical protein
MLHNRLLRIAPGYSVMTLTYRYVELPALARKRSTRVSPPAEEAVTAQPAAAAGPAAAGPVPGHDRTSLS